MESGGFEEGGILKLSRPILATSSIHPIITPDVSSPLPPPSERCSVDVDVDVPNMCAICLDSYQPGQVVAWSSSCCSHAFHQDCIIHYLAKKMLGGETPCPSCRQKFCDLPVKLLKKPSALPLPSSMIAGDTSATTTSTSLGEEASGQASV
jgi:hypothetical protein